MVLRIVNFAQKKDKGKGKGKARILPLWTRTDTRSGSTRNKTTTYN